MISQELIVTALEAEKNCKLFSINFDEVWETFGYNRKDSATRYLKLSSGLKRFNSKDLHVITNAYKLEKWNKILLSVNSYKFALARAATDEGEKYLTYLIEVEAIYRQKLELTFKTQIEELERKVSDFESKAKPQAEPETPKEDSPKFPHTLEELWKTSGIKAKYQVKKHVVTYFEKDKHYIEIQKSMFLDKSCFDILVLSLRSLKGTDIEKLPEIISVHTEEYFRIQALKRKNQVIANRYRKYGDTSNNEELFPLDDY